MHTTQEKAAFPNLETYAEIGKKEPKLFVKIIQKHCEKIGIRIREESKQKGIPITYRDEEYPDCLIQEEAGGRRFIIRLNPENNYRTEIIKEIPPRKVEQ
jgi:hypothetical protein